jgi:hypothetical protein
MADQEEIKEEIKDPVDNNEEKNEEQTKEKEKDKEPEKEVEFVNDTKSEHKFNIDPNFTAIEVIVRGTIEWGEFNEADGVCCTYEIVTGDSWSKERVCHFIRELRREHHNTHINHSIPKTGSSGISHSKITINQLTRLDGHN